jgi:hypothetical protein
MAAYCTFCYERVEPDTRGAVDFTSPVCRWCKPKFPPSRKISWDRAEQEYELPLEELKANCTWAPVLRDTKYILFSRKIHPGLKTYVFDERDVQRHVKRRYGGLDTFFAAIQKKRWNKELELERMAKQRRWAREEIERRITAGEPMVERFIAQQEELEKKRAEERQRICDELEARTKRREEMFRGWFDIFLTETAGSEGRCENACELERRENSKAADNALSELLHQERTIQYRIKAVEEAARDWPIQQFRLCMRKKVTADVLLQYGLDSLG